jgi:rhomboid family protein
VIPLRDHNPTRRTPVVTFGLIAACFAVFGLELAITSSGGDTALGAFFDEWGAVPVRISDALATGDYLSQATLTMVTSQFLHASWIHIVGNMLFLWIFGNNVEDRLGRLRFLVFYLAGGIVAALSQVWIAPQSDVPLVGASGAIAAALGAYIVLFPGARILSLVFLGFFYQLLDVPAIVILGYWIVLQLISGVTSLGAETAQAGVAFFAHIGGFGLGVIVALLMRLGRALGSGPRWGPMG